MRCRVWQLSWSLILGLLVTQEAQAKTDSTSWWPTLYLHSAKICKFNSTSEFLEFASLKKGSGNIERPYFQALALPLGWDFKHSDHFSSVFAVGPSIYWMSGNTKLGGNISIWEAMKIRKHGKATFRIGVDYLKPLLTLKKRPDDPFMVNPKKVFTFNIGWGTSLFKMKTPAQNGRPRFSFIPRAMVIIYSYGLADQEAFQGISLSVFLR